MILWRETAGRSARSDLVNALRHAIIATAAVAMVLISILYYFGRIRPDQRTAAGEIEVQRLKEDVSGDSVYGPAAGSGNAAAHYIRAINSYAARRAPYLKNRGFKAFVSEPPVSAQEIAELELGAKRQKCDFYEERNQNPRFKLARPGQASWAYRPALAPEEERPYYTPFRLLLVGITYQAEGLKRAGKVKDAMRLYGIVARVAAHVRQNPGCLLDFELGIEMETRALARIEAMFKGDRENELPRKVAIYRQSLEELEARIRRKYRQLDNPEAAATIALNDTDPIWRIEAAAALRDQSYHHAIGFLEQRSINQALERVKYDKDHFVRKAAWRIASSQPRPARDDTIKPL